MNQISDPQGHSVYGQTNYPLPPPESNTNSMLAGPKVATYPEVRQPVPLQGPGAPQDHQNIDLREFVLIDHQNGSPGRQEETQTFKSMSDWGDGFVNSNHITSIGPGRTSDELLLAYKNMDALAYFDTKSRVVKKAVKHGVKSTAS